MCAHSKTHLSSRFYFMLLALILWGTVFSSAHAQGNLDFNLRPAAGVTTSGNSSYFVYERQAGQVIEDTMEVSNLSDDMVTLVLYPATARVSGNGGLSFTHQGEPLENTARWIKLQQTTLTLAPQQTQQVRFSVQIPAGLQAGEFVAGIVAEQSASVQKVETGPVGVQFVPRMATTVMVTVPGVLTQQLEIGEISSGVEAGRQFIEANLISSGNVGVKPSGLISILDDSGSLVTDLPIELGYFIAGGELEYRAYLPFELETENYSVDLKLWYEGGSTEKSADVVFEAVEEVKTVKAGQDETPLSGQHMHFPPLYYRSSCWVIVNYSFTCNCCYLPMGESKSLDWIAYLCPLG